MSLIHSNGPLVCVIDFVDPKMFNILNHIHSIIFFTTEYGSGFEDPSIIWEENRGIGKSFGCEIDFEIKNIVYNMIMQKSFDLGLKKIADAFEERAIKLYTKK